MEVYPASPKSQQQAEHLANMDVLISYALYSPWLDDYQSSFGQILIDSGAFSDLNSKKKVDVAAYAEWAEQWRGHAKAVAGLDDIGGNCRRSLSNYAAMPKGLGFPTMHNTDPPELLTELVAIARERGGWIGLGLLPPRSGKEHWVREMCDAIPDDLHVHGWAMRAYTHVRRLDSVDSTNWLRDAMKLRTMPALRHLHYGECLDIVVKRYQRWKRVTKPPPRKMQPLV